MKKCLSCQDELIGRSDKLYCSEYCKSSYHYQKQKDAPERLFKTIDKQLKLNRQLLKYYNRAGKSTIRKQELDDAGFNKKYFTHYWKNKQGDVYLFCYEFGFLERKERDRAKYVLVKWQDYMN